MTQPNAVYLAKALSGRKEGRDFRCECPVHDNGGHLMITDKRGKLEMHCMMGAKWDELVTALQARGLWDLPPINGGTPRQAQRTTVQAKKELVAEYFYRNVDGEVIAIKGRFTQGDKKTFLWRRADADKWGGLGFDGQELPLYGAELLGSEGEVWFAEGEKAVHALRDQGLTAVSGYAGASVLPEKALRALENRRVIIWPDNDEQGRMFAIKVKTALNGLAEAALILSPQGSEKADAFDYFEGGGTVASLREAAHASPDGPQVLVVETGYEVVMDDVHFLFENVTHGKHQLEVDLTYLSTSTPGVSRVRAVLWAREPSVVVRRQGISIRLQDIFDRDKGYWGKMLNRAIALAKAEIADYDPSINIKDAPDRVDNGYIAYPSIACHWSDDLVRGRWDWQILPSARVVQGRG